MRPSMTARIAASIRRDYVENGLVPRGEQLPGIRALHERYGTSVTTIAHALGLLEAQGYVRKRHGQGCFVEWEAGVRRDGLADALGLVLGTFGTSELSMRIYAGVERACRRYGYHVVVATSEFDYENERQQVERMAEAGCRAVVLNPVWRTDAQVRTEYLNRELAEFPIVLVDMAYPHQKRSQVLFDNQRAGYEMTQWLLREGHRRIVFMKQREEGRELVLRSTSDRYLGYLAALREAGIRPAPDDTWAVPVDDRANLVRSFQEALLRRRGCSDRPTAVVAFEDESAVALITAARELGIDVPRDLTVVGFDDLSFASSFRPLFPSTRPDFVQAGDTAVELAVRHIRGELESPVVYMLPVPIKLPLPEEPAAGQPAAADAAAPR